MVWSCKTWIKQVALQFPGQAGPHQTADGMADVHTLEGAVLLSGTEGMDFLQPGVHPASMEAIYSLYSGTVFMSQPTHFYEGPQGKAVIQSYTSTLPSVKYKQYKSRPSTPVKQAMPSSHDFSSIQQ